MYLLSGNCDYCKASVARKEKMKEGDQLMITPNIPFLREIICANCWSKIAIKLDSFIENIVLETEEKKYEDS